MPGQNTVISMAVKKTPLSELHLYCKFAHAKSRVSQKKCSIRVAQQPASGIHYFNMPRQNTVISIAVKKTIFR